MAEQGQVGVAGWQDASPAMPNYTKVLIEAVDNLTSEIDKDDLGTDLREFVKRRGKMISRKCYDFIPPLTARCERKKMDTIVVRSSAKCLQMLLLAAASKGVMAAIRDVFVLSCILAHDTEEPDKLQVIFMTELGINATAEMINVLGVTVYRITIDPYPERKMVYVSRTAARNQRVRYHARNRRQQMLRNTTIAARGQVIQEEIEEEEDVAISDPEPWDIAESSGRAEAVQATQSRRRREPKPEFRLEI